MLMMWEIAARRRLGDDEPPEEGEVGRVLDGRRRRVGNLLEAEREGDEREQRAGKDGAARQVAQQGDGRAEQEAGRDVRARTHALALQHEAGPPDELAGRLVQAALRCGSRDNISALVLDLRGVQS